MQFKKLALTLTLSATFGLMACGDDSSSGPNNSDSGSELQKEFQEVQKEMMDGLEKLGKCTEDNAGEEKSVTVKGKDYKVVCEDGEWESDELDDLIEDYEKRIAEENGKHIDGEGCNFKKTDKVWSYNVSTDLYDEGTTHVISMEIDGTTLIEKSINTVTGGSISTACKVMSEDDMHDSEQIDKTKTIETITECDGDKMIVTDITKTTNAVDEEHNRDFYFEQFMGDCKMINGIEDDEDDEDDEGEIDDNVTEPAKENKDDDSVEPAKSESDEYLNDMISNPEKYGMTEEDVKAYQEAMKELEEATKAMEEMGECTADREGEKYKLNLYGEEINYICKNGEWGIDYEAYGAEEN